jgi:hypothetical protein
MITLKRNEVPTVVMLNPPVATTKSLPQSKWRTDKPLLGTKVIVGDEVRLFSPGEMLTIGSTVYRVDGDGSFRRVTQKLKSKKALKHEKREMQRQETAQPKERKAKS